MMFIGFLILFLLFFCCPNSIVFAINLNVMFQIPSMNLFNMFFHWCNFLSWCVLYNPFWCVCTKCIKNFKKLFDDKLYTLFICDFWIQLFSTTPSLSRKKYTLLMFNDKALTIVVLFEMLQISLFIVCLFCYKDINNYLVKL
jgi:hypothetical protein